LLLLCPKLEAVPTVVVKLELALWDKGKLLLPPPEIVADPVADTKAEAEKKVMAADVVAAAAVAVVVAVVAFACPPASRALWRCMG